MIRTILIGLSTVAFAAALLVACAGSAPAPAPIAVCEALRPDLPVKYHARTTDAETIANIRRANARFEAACPPDRS